MSSNRFGGNEMGMGILRYTLFSLPESVRKSEPRDRLAKC
jgi:hypothetical protein